MKLKVWFGGTNSQMAKTELILSGNLAGGGCEGGEVKVGGQLDFFGNARILPFVSIFSNHGPF